MNASLIQLQSEQFSHALDDYLCYHERSLQKPVHCHACRPPYFFRSHQFLCYLIQKHSVRYLHRWFGHETQSANDLSFPFHQQCPIWYLLTNSPCVTMNLQGSMCEYDLVWQRMQTRQGRDMFWATAYKQWGQRRMLKRAIQEPKVAS